MPIKRVVLVTILALFPAFASAKHDVLFIHSYDTQNQWVQLVDEGFKRALENHQDIRLFTEYIDAKRFPNSENQDLFYRHLLEKYRSVGLDAIVVCDDPALNLLRRHNNDAFHSIPLVFMGINQLSDDIIHLPNATGVFEIRDFDTTIKDIRSTFNTENLIIVSDTSSTGLANLSLVESVVDNDKISEYVQFIPSLAAGDITSTFRLFQPNVPILLIGQVRDNSANDLLMEWDTGIALITSKIPNPLITIGIPNQVHGSTAGHSLDGNRHAMNAANLLIEILEGVPVENVKPVLNQPSTWYFNWQKMKEHRISLDALPSDTILLFEDQSFLDQNRNLVIGFSIALSVALIIIILLLELVRRGRQTQKILRENEIRYRDLALEGANIFWETNDEDQFIYISGDTNAILNIDSAFFKGKSILELMKELPSVYFPYSDYAKSIKHKQPIKNMLVKISPGESRQKIVSISGKPMYSDKACFTGYRGIVKEITDEYNLTQKIVYEASHDSLTGLINRQAFNDRCKEEVSSSHASNFSSFVCFLDLDSFKMVNDTIGHMAGDILLAGVALKIKSEIKSNDTLGRLGGDEFGLVLKDKSTAEAMTICQNIIKSVSAYRMAWNDSYYSVGVSIGMVLVDSTITYQELLSHADIACYKAKEMGRGRVYFASEGDASLVEEKMRMGYIANINHDLEQNQFFFAKQLIQPILSAVPEPHYEILLRYRDRDGSIIPPGMFIPAAEKYGVITLIDLWVIEKVITEYDQLFDGEQPVISVNVSGISLSSEEFRQNVIKIVESASIDMSRFCFEITETAVINHIQSALNFITELKKYGCKFALDDFGSGSSSYGYLKQLPVDYLKIDGSLITSITTEEIDYVIVKSINEIAQSLGIRTVAEFVENDEVLSVLRDIGIDYGQGYGIHKPELL